MYARQMQLRNVGLTARQAFASLSNFSWPLIMGAAAFLFAVLRGSRVLNDGDTYWHIATGRWIVNHGVVPFHDPFSHTFLGAPWTAHEWLSDVFMYLFFEVAGWAGVVLLAAAAFAATLAYLSRFLHTYLAPAHVLLFSVLAIGMTASHLLARPHVLAMPLLVIWCAGLVRACEEGRTPKFWLLGVMVLWANLHGGFALGVVLTAAFCIEAVLLAKDRKEKLGAARKWGIFLLLAILAGALSPQGLEGYFFAAKVMNMSYALANIKEWLSPNFQKFQFLELWLLLLLLVALTRGIRLSPARVAVLLFLIHLALKHARNVELIGLLAPILLALPLSAQWGGRENADGPTEKLDRFFSHHARPASLPAVAITFFLVGIMAWYKLYQPGIMPNEKYHPIAAVQAVKYSGINGPVFNSYFFGGYLVFSGIPVFVDGRADLYGDKFIKRYLEAYKLPRSNNLEKLLDEYQVRWTLLPPKSPPVDYLDMLPNWRRAYADDTAIVHVRNDKSLEK